MIYFMVEALTMDRTNLPTQLNFGRHAIQTKRVRHGGQPPTATKAQQLQLGFYGSMIPAIVRKMASQGQTIHQLGQWYANIGSCRIKGSA